MEEQEQQSQNKTPAKGEARQGRQEEQNIQMEPTPLSEPPSHKKLIIGMVVVFILIVAGMTGAYFFFMNQNIEEENTEVIDTVKVPDPLDDITFEEDQAMNDAVEELNVPDGWKTYANDEFGFEVKYPWKWSTLNQLDNAYGIDFWAEESNSATNIMSINTGIDFSVIGVSYCGANPKDERCEVLETINGNFITIDWNVSGGAYAMFNLKDGSGASFTLHKLNSDTKAIFRKILSTFKYSITEEVVGDILIYEKRESWGPCANPDGGCFLFTYLYSSGKLVLESLETKEFQLQGESVDKIILEIKNLEIMKKKCEQTIIVDYSATYNFNIEGKTKTIYFPGCEDELKSIDSLIEEEKNKVEQS